MGVMFTSGSATSACTHARDSKPSSTPASARHAAMSTSSQRCSSVGGSAMLTQSSTW
eukprot:COSAG06_NODE_3637_length_5065_cov_7.899780_8_plen_57_part_00